MLQHYSGAMTGSREAARAGGQRLAKRGLDVVVSALALLILAPLLVAIAVAIAVTSGRPVFYVQRRTGLDGRVFRMLKFRTMIRAAEDAGGPVWATRDDPRCTALGVRLRNSHLDELPQLWNVLRGRMSLVGPRPERPVFVDRFRAEIPGYALRHQVLPGITGWAQVRGWSGDTSVHRRIEHDLDYIRRWSLAFDLRILWLTLRWAAPDRSGATRREEGRAQEARRRRSDAMSPTMLRHKRATTLRGSLGGRAR